MIFHVVGQKMIQLIAFLKHYLLPLAHMEIRECAAFSIYYFFRHIVLAATF